MTGTADMTRIERELDYRTNDGLEVRLVWLTGDDHLRVCVVDAKTREAFQLDVDGAHALDAFHHPYAYAAFRGIEFAEPRVPAEDPIYA